MRELREAVASPFADLELGQLRRRTSSKWRLYPDDVLPLWVAEMDAVIAKPIAEAVQEALEIGDTGYPFGHGYAEAFASFASERWGWSFDPTATTMVADVMSGVREVSRATGTADASAAASSKAWVLGFIRSSSYRVEAAAIILGLFRQEGFPPCGSTARPPTSPPRT